MKTENDANAVNWDGIFRSLEKWQKHANPDEIPAVSQVAASAKAEARAKAVTKTAADGPWSVLVSTILSLRTKDDVTRNTSRALLAKAPNPQKLHNMSVEEVTALAYPAGFYRTKAAQLKKIAAILLEKYDGKVPPDMDALLELPGAGRKTANLVLTEAFDMYGICVDVHVHRICNRAGWINTKNPEATEMILREILPKKYWKRINGLLVFYGQKICRPISPFCSLCVITGFCGRINTGRSR